MLPALNALTVALAIYHQCLLHQPGRDCDPLYRPVLEACRKSENGCETHLPKGNPGFLNFGRCSHLNSCSPSESGIVARLFPGDERAEVRDPFEAPFGTAMEYSFSVRVPAGVQLQTSNQSLVIAQLKANNDLSPPVAFRWKGSDRFTITVREPNGEWVVHQGTLSIGKWHGFLIQVRTGVDGYLKVIQDDQPIVDHSGPIGYPDTFTYFKMGPYDYTQSQSSILSLEYGFFWRNRIVDGSKAYRVD